MNSLKSMKCKNGGKKIQEFKEIKHKQERIWHLQNKMRWNKGIRECGYTNKDRI